MAAVGAARDQKAAVKLLLKALKRPGQKLQAEGLQAVLKALVVAADNGHCGAFALLLEETDPLQTKRECDAVKSSLCKAAEKGHLNVVKLVVSHAKTKRCTSRIGNGSKALAWAIAGGQDEMTEFLFQLENFQWNLVKAFVVAVVLTRTQYAKRIFKAYGPSKLFVRLARGGHLRALRALFPSTQKQRPQLVNVAFGSAAHHGRINVVAFLLSAASIDAATLDKAIEDATERNEFATVIVLYDTRRISPEAINKVFETTNSVAVAERLLENERIPDVSIIAALKKASGCSSEDSDSIRIVKLLHKKECISSETIGEAFVVAAGNNCRHVVECLHARVISAKFGEAFVRAAESGHLQLTKYLYDPQRVSSEAVLEAFMQAAVPEKYSMMELLIKLLSDEKCELKNKAFVYAAKHKKMTSLKLLNASARRIERGKCYCILLRRQEFYSQDNLRPVF